MSVTSWDELVGKAKLDEHLSMGEHLEALWRGEDQEEHFDAIITLMWELHPSGVPQRVILTMRSRGIEADFAKYVSENNRSLPFNHVEQAGLPRWWVIGPSW